VELRLQMRRSASRWYAVLAVLAGLSLPASSAWAQQALPSGEDLPVVVHKLANGMRFLILPRPGAPTVAFVTQYNVGSVNESLGDTGIAHMLEHLLFKGTTTIGTRDITRERAVLRQQDAVNDSIQLARQAVVEDTMRVRQLEARLERLEKQAKKYEISNEYDDILTRAGARSMNATTSYESTKYYVQLPANKLQLWFVLEADRMQNPVFREFYAERSVVEEERRTRLETTAGGLLTEEFYATAYHEHPYGVPVAGYMSDIENFTRAQVRQYYKEYYGPNNAVVAIVGDVDPDQVVRYADRYFGPIPARATPKPVWDREPTQRGQRRIEVIFDAEPELLIGWHVPDGYDHDMPALNVMASILAGGRTSRLNRRLVQRERIALAVSASLGPAFRYPLLFTIDAAPNAPHTTQELEKAIYAEIDSLKKTPPRPAEVQRIINQIEASQVRRLGSNLGLAFQLADSEVYYNDWRHTFRSWHAYQDVRPGDIQRVAQKYFTEANRTVGWTRRPRPGDTGLGQAPAGASSTAARDTGAVVRPDAGLQPGGRP
jgi:predicted Zn-dependent peptidase